MTNADAKPKDLKASVKSADRDDRGWRVVLRLSNGARRTLHYIADVRAIRYDPVARRLTLALSDEGRQVIPGTVSRLPQFRRIDPESEAEIVVIAPARIVKLSRSAPPGKLAFEQHQLAEVEEIAVEIAWADVPYYKDTRKAATDDPRLPAARWQQHKAQAVKRMADRKPR